MTQASSTASDLELNVPIALNSVSSTTIPLMDWNLFDAHGGIDLSPSAQEQGFSQIAEALLQYMEDDPDDEDKRLSLGGVGCKQCVLILI